jgi:hypothetical protein
MVVKQLVARPIPPQGPATASGQLRLVASNCRLSRNKRKGVFPCLHELLK